MGRNSPSRSKKLKVLKGVSKPSETAGSATASVDPVNDALEVLTPCAKTDVEDEPFSPLALNHHTRFTDSPSDDSPFEPHTRIAPGLLRTHPNLQFPALQYKGSSDQSLKTLTAASSSSTCLACIGFGVCLCSPPIDISKEVVVVKEK